MAGIITAKLIFSGFLGVALLSFARYLVDHGQDIANMRNSHQRFVNLDSRELALRISRFCPRVALRGCEMVGNDSDFCHISEGEFEEYIAMMYDEPNHYDRMADFIKTRYFFGQITHRPTDSQVWKMQEASYGFNHMRDAKRRDYQFYLSGQRFTRMGSEGNSRVTSYNEEILLELLGEAKFAKLCELKARLETPTPNAVVYRFKHSADMEWEQVTYLNERRASTRPDGYDPQLEFGNDNMLELEPLPYRYDMGAEPDHAQSFRQNSAVGEG